MSKEARLIAWLLYQLAQVIIHSCAKDFDNAWGEVRNMAIEIQRAEEN